MRRHPERTEQAGIVKLLRSIGGAVYVFGTTRRKGDYQGTMQTPGIPDLEVFLPPAGGLSENTLLKIEVKAPHGRLSPAQQHYRDHCIAACVPHIVGGLDDVIAWLVKHGYLKLAQAPHYRLKKGAS